MFNQAERDERINAIREAAKEHWMHPVWVRELLAEIDLLKTERQEARKLSARLFLYVDNMENKLTQDEFHSAHELVKVWFPSYPSDI